jgi:uncharacterized protein (DUF302 family)
VYTLHQAGGTNAGVPVSASRRDAPTLPGSSAGDVARCPRRSFRDAAYDVLPWTGKGVRGAGNLWWCRLATSLARGDKMGAGGYNQSKGGGIMSFLRNLFAIIGLVLVIAIGVGYYFLAPKLSEFDPEYLKTYEEFATRLFETGDPGRAMMWSVQVKEGLTPEEVIESLKSLATERNFLFVGESPFYKQVEAITGEEYRYVNFLSFCDARVGKMMLEYQDEYSGFMPCRIALVEDNSGRLWLHSMNLDLMIHGGKELPPDLKKSALRIRKIVWDMMHKAAAGEF